MSLPHWLDRCHRGAAHPATEGWLIAVELLTPDEHRLDMNREVRVENTHSMTTNTRIEIGQCGYLHFTGKSLGWQGKFQAAGGVARVSSAFMKCDIDEHTIYGGKRLATFYL